MKSITLRELMSRIDQVLRQVQQGQRVRITISGRPVADLVPIGGSRRTFVPRDTVTELLTRAALDRSFARDIATATGATIEKL